MAGPEYQAFYTGGRTLTLKSNCNLDRVTASAIAKDYAKDLSKQEDIPVQFKRVKEIKDKN